MKNEKVINNLAWRFLERFGAQGVTVVVSLVLARILDPNVYGIVAIVTVFTTIMQVFVDSGLGNALIQKKDADNVDFSTVFFFNIVLCLILYTLTFFLAPLIAYFYEMPELTAIIRVLGIVIIISGIKNVQQAYVSRNLLFRRFFFATLGGTLGAAILGIILAYKGFGVWALVCQMLLNTAVDTAILWLTVKWRPDFVFSLKRLKILLKFGWKLLVSSLIDTLYKELRTLVIGKKYTSDDTGYYNNGQKIPAFIDGCINASIDSVLLPTMSKEQDRKEAVRKMTRRAISVSSYIMLPVMIGLAVCSEPLIRLVLTEKWLPCVPYLRVFCITYAFYPIHTANLNAIKALGRSDLYLKLEVIKKTIGMAALLATMSISVEAIAYSLIFTAVTSQIVNSYPNKKLLSYSYFDQLKDIAPSLALSLVMGAAVYSLQLFGLPDIITLILQIMLGVIIYISGSVIFKFESFEYIKSILMSFLKKTKKTK